MAHPSQAQDRTGARSSRPMPPRTPYEEAVHSIWSEVLGRSDFDVFDEFRTLGDHSLAPKVVARLRGTFGIDVSVLDFFESRTVAALAALVAAKSAERTQAEPRAVTRRAEDAEPVLSFDQQRLWMENQLLPGSVYNVHGRRRLVGTLDVATLEAAVATIIARHETLRTRFPNEDGRPVQVVDDPDANWRIRREDLTGPTGDREAAARRLLDEESITPFDLARGPLLRCVLIRMSDTEHLLGVTMHHIVSDAWSIGLFIRELSALYDAGGDPERAELPPLAFQYRDYAVWQRAKLTGDALEQQVSHWRRHLTGAPPILALPTAQRRSKSQSAAADRILSTLSRDETTALHDLCREHGVTSFMALYAALATVLGRWSGQSDIVIGVPVAGRTDSATDHMIGFFVNVLPFRVDISGDLSFADLLARVRRVALDGYAHAEAPLDVLVQDLKVTRDPRRTPLFEVVLNVIGTPEPEQVTGLAVQPVETPSLFSRFDVSVTAQESGGVLQLKLDFAADRFPATLAHVLVAHIRALLLGAVADPSRAILDYPFDAPAEQTPTAALPAPAPHLAVDRHATGAERVAVADRDGSWSYAWLSRAAAEVARILIDNHVQPGDHLGVVRRPSAGFVAALLGCLRAGATFTVIEAPGPLDALGVTAILDPNPAGPAAGGIIDLSGLPPRDGAEPEAVRGGLEPEPAGDGVGIRLTRPESAGGDWAADRFGLGAADRFAVLSSVPEHLMSALSTAFGAGGTLVIAESSFTGDADGLVRWLREAAISVVYLDPSILRALTTRTPTPQLPALRHAFIENSGELISHDIVELRQVAPSCRCVGVYRVGADGRPLAAYEVPGDWQVRTAPLRVPLGRELPGTPAVLRRDSGHVATVGELGELTFAGRRTGDLGRRWPDGSLEFAGRAGVTSLVDPVETIATLRDVPDVRDAIVIEHTGTLLGYVTGPDPRLSTVGIHNYLVARLPEYLVPEHLFVLDELPRTPWGHYDLKALPRSVEDNERDDYVGPRTPMERRLTDVLQELLGVERVGIHDSFFELGGFSLLATQLTTRIRTDYQVELALREVFEAPTVDELAQLIVRAQGELSGSDDLDALLQEIEQSVPAPER